MGRKRKEAPGKRPVGEVAVKGEEGWGTPSFNTDQAFECCDSSFPPSSRKDGVTEPKVMHSSNAVYSSSRAPLKSFLFKPERQEQNQVGRNVWFDRECLPGDPPHSPFRNAAKNFAQLTTNQFRSAKRPSGPGCIGGEERGMMGTRRIQGFYHEQLGRSLPRGTKNHQG